MLTLWLELDSHEVNPNSNVLLGWTSKVHHCFEEFQHPLNSDPLCDVVPTTSLGLTWPPPKLHLCVAMAFWQNKAMDQPQTHNHGQILQTPFSTFLSNTFSAADRTSIKIWCHKFKTWKQHKDKIKMFVIHYAEGAYSTWKYYLHEISILKLDFIFKV